MGTWAAHHVMASQRRTILEAKSSIVYEAADAQTHGGGCSYVGK